MFYFPPPRPHQPHPARSGRVSFCKVCPGPLTALCGGGQGRNFFQSSCVVGPALFLAVPVLWAQGLSTRPLTPCLPPFHFKVPVPGKSRGQWAKPHFWAHNTGYNWARGHFLKSKIYFLFCLATHPRRGGGPGTLCAHQYTSHPPIPCLLRCTVKVTIPALAYWALTTSRPPTLSGSWQTPPRLKKTGWACQEFYPPTTHQACLDLFCKVSLLNLARVAITTSHPPTLSGSCLTPPRLKTTGWASQGFTRPPPIF